MNNISELRDELLDSFTKLKSGDMEAKTMSELSNAAGKIINTAKVQIEYNTLAKNGKKIKFLECE